MAVNYINLNSQNDNDRLALDTLNKLSELEGRKPHDTLRRLILEAGSLKIKELSGPSEMNPPSNEGLNDTQNNPESQEKSEDPEKTEGEVAA